MHISFSRYYVPSVGICPQHVAKMGSPAIFQQLLTYPRTRTRSGNPAMTQESVLKSEKYL
jgi:hypothetical protein